MVDTERLTLRNHQGNVIGIWGANPRANGSALLLYDQNGVNRLGLYASDGGDASVDLRDPAGKSKARVSVLGNSVPLIHLFGTNNDEPSLMIQVSPDGSSMVAIGNSKKANQIRMNSSTDGDTFLTLAASSGKEAINAYSRVGRSGLSIFDVDGGPAVGVRAVKGGERGIMILDNRGVPKAGLALDRDQKPFSP
jgi:hypothetical protein